MPTLRSIITHFRSTDPPADYCTNTVYHTIGDGIFDPGVDYQNHANQMRDLFSGADTTHALFREYVGRHIQVKVYNMADAEPRPVQAEAVYTPATQDVDTAYLPGQVACVLSFYGTRNLPRQRGHIYIGPLKTSAEDSSRVSAGVMNDLLDLGHGLFDIGGENVAHVIHSRAAANDVVVANYWVDNRFDTQRRRLSKATQRVTLAP